MLYKSGFLILLICMFLVCVTVLTGVKIPLIIFVPNERAKLQHNYFIKADKDCFIKMVFIFEKGCNSDMIFFTSVILEYDFKILQATSFP